MKMLVLEAKLKNGTPEQYQHLDKMIQTAPPTKYELSDYRRKIKFINGSNAGEFDLWYSQNTLVYYTDQQIKQVKVVKQADDYYCQFIIDLKNSHSLPA